MSPPHDEKRVSETSIAKEQNSHSSEAHYPVDLTIKSTTSVLLSSEVYFKMVLHGLRYAHPHENSKTWKEVIGLLTGRLARVPEISHEIIQIDEAWPVGHGNAISVKVQDYGTLISRILDEKDDRMVICGWYHSHPGYGLFMSQTDYQTQISYQRLWDRAIGLVIDPTLISTKHEGFSIFRLIRPAFKTFHTLPYRFADGFSLNDVTPIIQRLTKFAIQKDPLEEFDYQSGINPRD